MADDLAEAGVEHYCPLHKVTRQWSDRRKTILEPVFKGYVFVRIEEEHKWDVRKFAGILNFVHWLGKPAKIRNEEIGTIKKFLNEFEDVRMEKRGIGLLETVRITQGVLMNYEGMVISVFGNRAIVRIDSMDIQLSAQFDKSNLELVGGRGG